MADLIARLAELLRRFVRAATGGPCPGAYPYTCDYVGGVTARCTGERPPRGEDSPLVRPYFDAHEQESEARRLAELRQRRVLVVAAHGWRDAA